MTKDIQGLEDEKKWLERKNWSLEEEIKTFWESEEKLKQDKEHLDQKLTTTETKLSEQDDKFK